MIRINLLGEKVDHSTAYFFHGVALVGTLVTAMIACFIFHDSVSLSYDLATQEKAILDGKLSKLNEKTKKVENLERDKNLLKEKLTTIARLKAKKSGPVHLLDDITLSIPERSWLSGIRQKTDGLEFTGVALDPQTVSGFMTKLQSSKWISGVELVFSRQALRKGVPVQEFSLLIKLKNALDVNRDKNAPPAKAGDPAVKAADPAADAKAAAEAEAEKVKDAKGV